MFIKPRMEELESDDSAEMACVAQISGEYDFDPLSIADEEFNPI
jgi:hypothetical protein